MIYFFKNKFFRNIFLTYALLTGGLLLLFFGIFVYQANRAREEKMFSDADTEARLMAQILDNKFGDIELIATQITSSNWENYVNAHSDILYSRVDYFKKREICEVVDNFNTLLGIAGSTAILYIKRDTAVDSKAFWESERYFKVAGLSADFKDTAVNITQENYNALVMCRDGEAGNVVILKRLDHRSQPSVILMTVIDDKLFQRFFKINMPNVGEVSLILNDDIVYRYENNSWDYSEKNDYCIMVPSDIYQWEYRFRVFAGGYETNAYMTWITLFSFMGVFLLALFLAYGLTRYTYRPIQKVVARMNIYKNDCLTGLEEIEHSYENLYNEKETMENLANQYYEIGKHGFLVSLLKGTYDKNQVEERLKQFHTGFRQDMEYMVLAIMNPGMEEYPGFMDGILNLQSRSLREEVVFLMFEMNKNCIMILGTDMGEERRLNKVCEGIRLLMDEYPDNEEAQLLVGGSYGEIAGIHKSWLEVRDKISGNGVGMGYYYPFELENRLINTMRVGNFTQAEKMLEEIRVGNESREILPEQICKVVSLLYEDFVRFAIEEMLPWTGNGYLLREMGEERKISEMWDFLRECLWQMDKIYSSNEQTNSIGEQIVAYVQENSIDSGISQQIIADYFNISRPAVSKIFKETTGMNFIEYLHRQRIAHAKALVAQGNFDVIDVALKSGYENEITFKRAFVKYEGVTPREYVKHRKRAGQ